MPSGSACHLELNHQKMILLCSAYCRRALCIARHSGAHWNLMARSKCYLEIKEPLGMPNSSNVTKLIERVNLKPHILHLKSSVMKFINKIKTTELLIRTSWSIIIKTIVYTKWHRISRKIWSRPTWQFLLEKLSESWGTIGALGIPNTLSQTLHCAQKPPVAIQVTLVTVG